MPATSGGLPYPAATDPVSQGAAAIQALAEALDEFGYAQFTANVVATGATAAAAIDVVSAAAINFDGLTKIMIEFYCGFLGTQGIVSTLINLWDGAIDLGVMAQVLSPAAGTLGAPCVARRRLTPAAGPHTYKARIWSTGPAAGCYAGASPTMPGYIRITPAA